MPDDDETLLRDLGDAVADSRAVSETARAAARAAFTWRTIDEELLELDHDSESAGLLVRGVDKAKCIALWAALAYNVLHFFEGMIG